MTCRKAIEALQQGKEPVELPKAIEVVPEARVDPDAFARLQKKVEGLGKDLKEQGVAVGNLDDRLRRVLADTASIPDQVTRAHTLSRTQPPVHMAPFMKNTWDGISAYEHQRVMRRVHVRFMHTCD